MVVRNVRRTGLRRGAMAHQGHTALLAALVLCALGVGPAPVRAGAPTQITVYLAIGKGAVSALEKYYGILKGGAFGGQNVPQVDRTSGTPAFLASFFNAHIVYMNMHSSKTAWTICDGSLVRGSDLSQEYSKHGKGPSLVAVAGCKTVTVQPGQPPASMFAGAIGITNTTPKRAYIGFSRLVVGLHVDMFFRVFFAHWRKPKPDGTYRTLLEAKRHAAGFIRSWVTRYKIDPRTTGTSSRLHGLIANVGSAVIIIGDPDLTWPDVVAAAARAAAASTGKTPTGTGGTTP